MVTYGGVGLGRVRQAGRVGSCYIVAWQARLGTARGVRYGPVEAGEVWCVNARSVGA